MNNPRLPVRCGWCGAHAGDPCRTPAGKPARTHALRWADYESGNVPRQVDNVVDLEEWRITKRAQANGYTGP